MKKILFVLFSLISLVSKAQVYQEMPQYGYRANRMAFDSTLSIPTVCGVPTLKSNMIKKAAIAFDSCNNKFYKYNPKTKVWSEISGGSSQSLQDVTDIGNTTTNEIILTNGNFLTHYRNNSIYRENTNTGDDFSFLLPVLNNQTFALPDQGGYIPVTVNGIYADTHGEITIPIADTTDQFVNSITKFDDSTLNIVKGTSNTNITITGVDYATKLKTSVWNNSGATITKGSVVYINGAHSSNLPSIALAKSNNEATSAYTYGLVENDITNNSSGTVIQNGKIAGLNLPTTSYTDGQTLYLSPTIAGGYTTTKPTAPNHYVAIGTITRAHPVNGSIQVAIRNGFQLDELSDVKIAAVPADSTILQFSRVDSLWHDVSITNAIGTKYIKPSDTATMLSNYQRSNTAMKYTDTATMLSKYMRYTDSTAMLSKYLRKSDTTSMLVNYMEYADSTAMLSKYLRKTDTSTLSSRIDNKGYTLGIGHTAGTYVASTTYYFGGSGLAITSTQSIRRIYIPQSGTIKSAYLYLRATTTTSTENWTMSIRLNASSSTTLATVGTSSIDKVFSNTGLNISVVAGDYIEIITTTPAWTSAPGSTFAIGNIFIQ